MKWKDKGSPYFDQNGELKIPGQWEAENDQEEKDKEKALKNAFEKLTKEIEERLRERRG